MPKKLVLIVIDDADAELLGPKSKTPNIDAMMKGGHTFTDAFANSSLRGRTCVRCGVGGGVLA